MKFFDGILQMALQLSLASSASSKYLLHFSTIYRFLVSVSRSLNKTRTESNPARVGHEWMCQLEPWPRPIKWIKHRNIRIMITMIAIIMIKIINFNLKFFFLCSLESNEFAHNEFAYCLFLLCAPRSIIFFQFFFFDLFCSLFSLCIQMNQTRTKISTNRITACKMPWNK